MGTYLFELPTTGAFSFSDVCLDNGTYTAYISEATQSRASLRSSLKEIKRADVDEKDYLRLVKVIEEYIPYLLGIMSCVSTGEIALKSEPVFSWRTTLSPTLFNTSPRRSIPSLHADLAFSLLTYAFALANLARSSALVLGAYEHERGISDAERKQKDEKLNHAVTLLCRASGVFAHISENVLVDWANSRSGMSETSVSASRPPDLSRDVNNALAKLSLADAQSLAVRKLLTRSAYDAAITPGPPLPKSHPAPALVAKLHLECEALYASALALVGKGKNLSRVKGSEGSAEVCTDIKRYLAEERAFHSALARKWLGIDAGEGMGSSRGGGGEAVGFLVWARKELDELKGGPAALGHKEKKAKVIEEYESVNVYYKYYKKVNDSLTFQPVPPQADLQARIPSGRLAISVKPYVRPLPAFGPGSTEYMQKQAESLAVLDEAPAEVPEETKIPHSTESYAGEGSYF